MIRALFFFMIALGACGGRVTEESDASIDGGSDAAKTNDGATSTNDDGGTNVSSSDADAAVVTCGPNTCHAGEICCNAKCGVCTFPDECVIHDCGGP